jgi:hypothetical protein
MDAESKIKRGFIGGWGAKFGGSGVF